MKISTFPSRLKVLNDKWIEINLYYFCSFNTIYPLQSSIILHFFHALCDLVLNIFLLSFAFNPATLSLPLVVLNFLMYYNAKVSFSVHLEFNSIHTKGQKLPFLRHYNAPLCECALKKRVALLRLPSLIWQKNEEYIVLLWCFISRAKKLISFCLFLVVCLNRRSRRKVYIDDEENIFLAHIELDIRARAFKI